MSYLDYNGMIRQGNPGEFPNQNTSPNSLSYGGIQNQSVNGASNWSPWPGQVPGTNSNFQNNNYAPKPPASQQGSPFRGVGMPNGMPATSQPGPSPPASGNVSPATGGSQPGVGEINTGIKSGLLPDSVIQQAVGRLGQQGSMNLNMPGMNVSPAAMGEIQANQQNAFHRGTQEAQTNQSRDAAYQQAQMALAHQKAQAGASLQGMQNLTGDYDQQVSRNLAQRQMQLDLLSSLLGGI